MACPGKSGGRRLEARRDSSLPRLYAIPKGLQSSLDLCGQLLQPLALPEVAHVPDVRDVEGYVGSVLRDHDDFTPQDMCDAQLVEDIRVPTGEVADHDLGVTQQCDNILNYVVVDPDVVGGCVPKIV